MRIEDLPLGLHTTAAKALPLPHPIPQAEPSLSMITKSEMTIDKMSSDYLALQQTDSPTQIVSQTSVSTKHATHMALF